MTKIELTDDREISDFKQFCQYRQEWLNEHNQWKQLKAFAQKMQFGSFNLTIKDGLPVRVDNPMQSVTFVNLTRIL